MRLTADDDYENQGKLKSQVKSVLGFGTFPCGIQGLSDIGMHFLL